MVDSLIDPKLEGEMNTFLKMKPKERAEGVREIGASHTVISNFINSARKFDLRAPALKFGLENIKQKYQLLSNQWRRTQKLVESAGVGVSRPEISVPNRPASPTGHAVEKYVESLKNLGHEATSEMVDEFKNRLDAAYKTAKEKSGGRDLDIHIIQDGGKIKVRMEPK
jgi:hypothetical protein